MSDLGPAGYLSRRSRAAAGERPYPPCADDATSSDVALAALRALVRAQDPYDVRDVVQTAVRDLGGVLVPARLEPQDALDLDVSLGLGDPTLVVVDPLSIAAVGLRDVLPALLEDARAVLDRYAQRAAPTARGTASATPDDLAQHLELLSVGDLEGARRWTGALLDRGVSAASLVEDVLAPAQREVGERWYRGTWSVADEHAASAVTEACLALLPRDPDGPLMVVAAPEGEWHALPGRMLAAAVVGVRARTLGPGLPADHLRRFLEAQQPDVLALSCTMATNLLSAARSITAGRAAGVPVVVGGRAFGPDTRRAVALGADAWAARAADMHDVTPIEGDLPEEPPHEALVADAVPDELLLLALERQAAASPWVRAMDARQHRESLADLRWITRHAAAALACDDPSVLDDLLRWLDVLLAERGVPAHVLPDGGRYLADALEPETPRVAGLVREAVARLR